ncbi:RagB/SusD family nutrient uptake outer membrane protein [Chryseobacterium indologenes]|uniref:RagB/SusD family nutrient uptake outer membrane protein n=1 Tax=Chryseobacterium indologenes TaxID=253 RepID=UPI000BFD1345|nr:RagB/SusD family nutrient uptake outer membrane protein [Chryseobacterium indologenes]ATN05859.1 RagB/SusD family nutrient uptake outer membrane protein [Chryseobacterium indologenes]AYY85382.1 RagB/SusD family nutrient uptake outer membrane protein [Chryseobacterium indologenes]QIX82278.1 RagB/SusD family nutrient uptake outer membrane protein [Chryseobacterium indologenes]UDQ56071.1 RagB/SusD family nutrient uptake outer membrane protein [Chryseobacterium indologenes]
MKTIKYFIATIAIGLSTSCANDLNTLPDGDISGEQLNTDKSSPEKILGGIYLDLRSNGAGGTTSHSDFGIMAMKAGADLMSNDVIQSTNQHLGMFYNYEATNASNIASEIVWTTFYARIFVINKLLDELKNDTSTKNRAIKGQLLALRAYSYFYLVRFYANDYKGHESNPGLPLVLTSSNPNQGLPRSTVAEVYGQITKDIEESILLLDSFARPTRAQIDQRTAKAIAAEVYLQTGNYVKAGQYAEESKDGVALMTENEYTTTGFSNINNPEVIWGFHNTISTMSIGNYYASFFSMFDNTNEGYAGAAQIRKLIDKRLYEAIPETDYRKKVFNGSQNAQYTFNGKTKNYPPYVSWKFKDPSLFEGDYIYIRASSLYYIEAEALARQGREAEARQVLFNIASKRDTGYILSSKSGNDLINEIILQKRIELWGEGYAWFDMKRLNIPLERVYTGTNHTFGRFNLTPDKFKFQIPNKEINNNPQIKQND